MADAYQAEGEGSDRAQEQPHLGDVGEIWARYGRDMGEIYARYGRGIVVRAPSAQQLPRLAGARVGSGVLLGLGVGSGVLLGLGAGSGVLLGLGLVAPRSSRPMPSPSPNPNPSPHP